MGLRLAFWKPHFSSAQCCRVAGVAFVGLVSPHIARLLRPPSTGWAAGLPAAIGGPMVVTADVVARSVAERQAGAERSAGLRGKSFRDVPGLFFSRKRAS